MLPALQRDQMSNLGAYHDAATPSIHNHAIWCLQLHDICTPSLLPTRYCIINMSLHDIHNIIAYILTNIDVAKVQESYPCELQGTMWLKHFAANVRAPRNPPQCICDHPIERWWSAQGLACRKEGKDICR